MKEARDSADAPFPPNPEPIEGHCLVTEKHCPIKVAELNARLTALPDEPSESFKKMTAKMALLRPTETGEEWQRMRDKIMEWDRIVVAESTKGGDAVPASNSSQST